MLNVNLRLCVWGAGWYVGVHNYSLVNDCSLLFLTKMLHYLLYLSTNLNQ